MKTANKIRVGPAGWSYTDWEGVVYPPHKSKFDHLAYLASFFDTIEINSPFYRIPPPTHARSWVRRVSENPDFKFTTKVFRGFTHEAAKLAPADVKAFRNYLDPLMEADRLGAILLQFPWSFKNSPESCEKLSALFKEFGEYPKALEVRHSTFQNEEFFDFLGEHDVAWVNVDQPLFDNSVKPSDTVTGPLAYARFHGRNYEKWFAHKESWERYNYLYTQKELEPWVERIETMAKNKDTYVVTNNHFRGQAIVNAGEIRESLGLENTLPPQLKEVYPDRVSS
ncbi:MAG TPA: DUF72 domain-containing protein [Thermoanaerobaculia bacterium]